MRGRFERCVEISNNKPPTAINTITTVSEFIYKRLLDGNYKSFCHVFRMGVWSGPQLFGISRRGVCLVWAKDGMRGRWCGWSNSANKLGLTRSRWFPDRFRRRCRCPCPSPSYPRPAWGWRRGPRRPALVATSCLDSASGRKTSVWMGHVSKIVWQEEPFFGNHHQTSWAFWTSAHVLDREEAIWF